MLKDCRLLHNKFTSLLVLSTFEPLLILAPSFQVSRLQTELSSASASLARESQRVEELERKLSDNEEALQLKTAQLRYEKVFWLCVCM